MGGEGEGAEQRGGYAECLQCVVDMYVETRWRQLASRRHDVAAVVCMQPVVAERSSCVVIPNYFRLELTTDGGNQRIYSTLTVITYLNYLV